MAYGSLDKIEKIGEDSWRVTGHMYDQDNEARTNAWLEVWSKSRNGYHHSIISRGQDNKGVNFYFDFNGSDYDVTKPMTGYAIVEYAGNYNAGGWLIDKKNPLDNPLTYTEPAIEEPEEEPIEEVEAVTKTIYVPKRKADGSLWEFPFDGAATGNDALIQTRPMKLDSDDLKGAFRVVLRGLFVGTQGKSSGLYVSGSIDGKRWMYLGGTERKHTDVPVRDIGTTVERNSCRFLMAVFVGNLLPESRIEYFDITTADRYTEKPR